MLLFLLLAGVLHGQELVYRSVKFPAEYRRMQVTQVLPDRSGYLWLATQQGLLRYDGHHFIPLLPPDSATALAPITSLYQDRAGRLWVGYKGGKLYYQEGMQLKAPAFSTAEIQADISSILEDAQGHLWLATLGDGIYQATDSVLRHFTAAQGLPDDYVYSLVNGPQGSIWAGTDRGIGVCSLAGGKLQVQRIGMAQGLPDNIVRVLRTDAEGNIWAGTYAGGFCRLSGATKAITYVPERWEGGAVTSLHVRSGQVWVGTATKGVLLFEEAATQGYRSVASALEGVRITALAEDHQNNIWIAADKQLLVADPAMRSYSFPTKFTNLYAVYPSEAGVWLATEKGLYRYDLASGQLNNYLSSREEFPISSLFEDKEGNIWYGTLGGGLFRFSPASKQQLHLTEAQGLPNDNILSMAASPEGTLWMTTLGGISHFTPAENPHFTLYQNQHPKTNYVYDVLPDQQDGAWFATDGEGIARATGTGSSNVSEEYSLPDKVIYAIRAAGNRIGFLTAGSGIRIKKEEQWQLLKLENGLRSLDIAGFSLSEQGYLLAAHAEGIDVQDLESGQWRYYDTEYGIEPMDVYHNAVRTDKKGQVWVGTPQRLFLFAGDRLGRIAAPKPLLTDVQLFYETVDPAQSGFSHDENHFSFRYAGLWYHQPERVLYELMLQGYDTKWQRSRDGVATYSNLPPGDYTFKVRSSISTNFAGSPEASYSFRIARPYWQQLWFLGLAAILVIGAVMGVVKYREKQLLREEQLKQDAVSYQLQTLRSQINPHFLFNSFNTLIMEIEDKGPEAVEYVERLSDFFRSILTYQNKHLIPLQEELQLAKIYLYLQQKRYGESLHVLIDVDEAAADLQLPPLTLQLLVENAIKHNVVATSKPLTIKIYTRGPLLVVENNLQKKRTREVSTGIGLANITDRYRLLTRQSIVVEEQTLTFTVTLPLIKHG